jgi:hypothetical protein
LELLQEFTVKNSLECLLAIGAVICTGFFEAKTRYGLCVLDYMVTSNHVHLLVKDTGADVIPRSMQLIAGATAQNHESLVWIVK